MKGLKVKEVTVGATSPKPAKATALILFQTWRRYSAWTARRDLSEYRPLKVPRMTQAPPRLDRS